MRFRRIGFALAVVVTSFVVGPPVLARAAVSGGWRTVTYHGVSLRVPAAWTVLNLSRHPAACPRLNVHVVYLGMPGPDPSCPAGAVGQAEAVWIRPADPAGPDAIQATAATTISGQAGRTDPGGSVNHVIVDILPSAGAEVSIYDGGDAALARRIRAGLRLMPAAGPRAAARAARPGRAAALARPMAAPAAAPAQAPYQGGGFDSCAAPGARAMTDWLASPYRAVGIYIGGLNRACAQANLTASWIGAIQKQGWHYFPIYAGLQASCVRATGDAVINPAKAAAEGKAAATDAATQAQDLGIPHGTPIVFDMEAYAGCGPQVVTFLSSWDSRLQALSYQSAVYESFSNIGDLIKAAATMTEPNVIYYADWDGHATTKSSYMPATMWTNHQRIHQYQGGHNESWGGATINIDNDQLDTALGGPAPAPVPARTSFRVAAASNVSNSAEWFAKAANHTLVHDYQNLTGRQTWSGIETVGVSPDDIASNPAVAADANGDLTVFARTTSGLVAHAWQQPSAPDGWQWGALAGTGGSPGAITRDPGAARRPGGDVEVFVTRSGGTVSTTRQTAPNADSSWTRWQSIGGSCASSPVPLPGAHRKLAVFCVTKAGTAAVDNWRGGSWHGWDPAGASPSGLTANPAVLSGPAGQTELFVTTASGGLDYAWQSAGGWTWGTPLADGSAGQQVQGTPAAIRWPDGQVRVFAQLASGQLPPGQLGVISQQGTSGPAAWSGWTTTGATTLGSPAAWISASGIPAAGGVDARLRMGSTSFASGKWSAWTRFGGGF
jgi:Domain of unknown function (DUF1906)